MSKKERNSTVDAEWEKACETVRRLEADVDRQVYRAWHGLPLEEKTMTKKDYDVKLVTRWECPEENGIALLTMPNIPTPMHTNAPRTVLGASTWDHMRKRCYFDADYKCEVCGENPGVVHAHELYTTDWEKGRQVFVRAVCLCPLHHIYCIHTGRAITLHKQGNVTAPASKLLEGAESCFSLIHKYNEEHPDKEPLRVYATWLDYLKCEDLRPTMERLINQYEMKFYKEDPKKVAKWEDWRLVIGKREFPSKYASKREWAERMTEREKADSRSQLQNPFTGGIYDELNKILQEERERDG